MNDPCSIPDERIEAGSSPLLGRRAFALFVLSALLVLATVVVTLSISRSTETEDSNSEKPSARAPDRLADEVPLGLGSQDVIVDTVTIPAGSKTTFQLHYDVGIGSVPSSTSRAAFVSFRVDCADGGVPVQMQAAGKAGTNVFLSHGGNVSGQALTPSTDRKLECNLLASAPFAKDADDGANSLPLRAKLRIEATEGNHVLASHRLDDATLIEPGTNTTVLSARIDNPAIIESMSTAVRVTSCTVVGGSRDGGANKCTKSMAGKESSTVRIRVIARWLDADGNIESTSTYWDETLAVDYSTHHVPWNLRQGNMADRVPNDAQAVVLVVQAKSIAGTPVVVHEDGTDAIITTRS